jgi:transcription-repair coupling factor (superfamily II helicase)
MEMYKKIAAVQNQAELDSVWAELSDRFGTVPDEVSSLLSLAKIRIVCNQLSISSLKEKKGLVRAEFADVAKISTDKILRLVKSGGGRVSLDSSAPNVLILKTLSIDLKSKCDFIKEKLETLL